MKQTNEMKRRANINNARHGLAEIGSLRSSFPGQILTITKRKLNTQAKRDAAVKQAIKDGFNILARDMPKNGSTTTQRYGKVKERVRSWVFGSRDGLSSAMVERDDLSPTREYYVTFF